MGGFCLLVELHGEGSAPAACAAGLLLKLLAQALAPEEKSVACKLQLYEKFQSTKASAAALVANIGA